jgi:diguanylate cyclase (GGDEF)-like protein
MNPARRVAPWLFAAGAVVLVVAGVGFGTLGGQAWRWVVGLICITSCLVAGFGSRVPWFFAAATLVGGVRVILLPAGADGSRTGAIDVAGNIASLIVGVTLMVILALALRFRRGGLDARDGIDLLTVTIGSSLATWIIVVSELIFADGVARMAAFSAAVYLPIAVLLFTFVVDLMCTGLESNRTMHFLTLSALANVLGSMAASLGVVGIVAIGTEVEVSLFAASFAFLAAGLAHRHAAETVSTMHLTGSGVAYTPLRLALTALCLIVPGVLVASIAPYGRTDILVRVSLLVALVATVIARLVNAVRSHEAASDALVNRIHLDDLTQLPTRERFVREVDAVLDATWRSEFQPTIIQLNLDRFKNINDSLGHADANQVLVIVGSRLTAAAAMFGGTVGRSGGDDFVVIDATTRSSSEAMERLESVRSSLAEPVIVGDHRVFVTASFGVAVAPRNRTLTAEEFMRRADIATHRAKAAGRNSVAVFDDSMQAHLSFRMDVENALHGAIGRQEMRLYHQPIVDIRTGHVSGFESLIRWQRDGKIVSPAEFIPIAEETGIICELGEWALHEALNELRGWIDDGVVDPDTTISVNVSPRQIADPQFADVVRRALRDTGMPADLLWLEMTESMMLEEPELAESTLRQIREMGVRLALDDFGTGYSSLSLLQQFPIQRIKIDRAFVNGIAEQGNDRSLVRTIIAMAQSMGLDLVAEGVETVQQLQALNELNCDKAQGFLISRPVPPDAMRSTMVALDELASLSLFGSSGEMFPKPSAPRATPEPSRHHAEKSGRRSDPVPIGIASMASRPLGQPVV